MADEIIIETTSAEVIEVGVPGPQGPAGAAGAGLTTLTTAGDLLYRNATEPTRLPVGSNGQVLKVSGGLPAWGNESGAVTSVNGATGAITVAAATHATEHEAGEADEIQAMAAVVTTDDASLNGIYVPNASGTTSGGRLTLYKTGTRQNTKLEYNQSLSIWRLIKNAVVQLSGQQANATYAWTTQQWLDERSPQVLPNGGTVTRAGLEVLARRAADGTSNVATATTSEDGLLSSTDKTKLNGIAANATANTASSATPSALGTASAGSATDYARADHTHSAEVSDSAFRVTGSTDATKKVAIEVDTNVPSGQTVTLIAPSSGGTLALAGAAPASHAASHAAAGSDPLAPSSIGAQSLFVSSAITGASNPVAARAIIYDVMNLGSAYDINLPITNSLQGDIFVFRTVNFMAATVTIKFQVPPSGPQTVGTLTAVGEQLRFVYRANAQQWDLVPVDTHTHAASSITSGTLTHERGGLEADVSAYNGLVKISGGSTSAVTVTSAGEALLDDADAAAQRTTLGLGTAATAATGDFAAASHTHAASAITSGVLDNARINFAAPAAIGSTTPNTVAATDLSASNKLSLPSAAAASPTAGDLYRNANTLRYRDGTNAERLLLNASDNLANLSNTATARTNLGLGGAATLSVGTTTGTVAAGDDSRFHTRSHAMTGTSDHTASNWSVFYSNGSGQVTELALGAANTVLTSNGASSAPSFAAAAAGGSKTYAVFTAEHNQPPSTAFATLDTRNSIAVLDFDDATTESAVFVGIMPEAASLGSGLIVRIHFMATTATSGNVRWSVSFERGNTDLDADSFDTATAATTATSSTSGIPAVSAITCTSIDGITAGDLFRVRVQRIGGDAADTMSGDAELVAVELRSAA